MRPTSYNKGVIVPKKRPAPFGRRFFLFAHFIEVLWKIQATLFLLFYLCLKQKNISMSLPKNVFYKEEFTKQYEWLQRKIDAAKTAWKQLQAMPDFAPFIPNLESANDGVIRKVVSNGEQAVYASWMPAQQKKEAVDHWKQLGLKAYSYIRQITWAADIIRLQDDGQGGIEPAEDVKAKAVELSTKATPHKAQEHFEQVVKALDAVKALRAYEEANEINSIFLQQLQWLADKPENFAREWITGTFAEVSEEENEKRKQYGWKRKDFQF